MKYEIPMTRSETRIVQIYAATPHDALARAKELNEGFSSEYVSEIIEDPDEPGTEIENCGWSVEGHCEGCGVPIITADKYYQWGGEEAVMTCLKCGGADETHEPSIA